MQGDFSKLYEVSGVAFRTCGKGSPLILFHPSPNSSEIFTGFAKELSETFTVIAFDTPGYGSSRPMVLQNPSMTDYIHHINRVVNQLGVDKMSIYGSATGAQLAIRYGNEYPDKIYRLYLDNSAHFTEEEVEKILVDYFPDLAPREDGKHIERIWEIVSCLFQYFPWCFKEEAFKLSSPMPPVQVLHVIALDYLKAGEHYAKAYKAAFQHEKVEYIQSLTVPTTIFRWEGSIVKKYTDRIFDYELSDNISGCKIDKDPAQRYASMAAQMTMMTDSQEEVELSNYMEYDEPNLPVSLEELGERPVIENTGEYLSLAWQMIAKKWPNLSPVQVQYALIRWYRS